MEVASETAWLWEWHAVLPGLPWQLTCGFQVHSWSEFLGLGEILPCVSPVLSPMVIYWPASSRLLFLSLSSGDLPEAQRPQQCL